MRFGSAGRAARAQVQYPIAAILSCADSRVAPELVFDQAPGLKNSPSLVRKRHAERKIDIVGAMYDLATGKVTMV